MPLILGKPKSLRTKPLFTWLSIGLLCVYFVTCWVVYFISVDPKFGNLNQITIEADSGAYLAAAGVDADKTGTSYSDQVSFGGSVIGPVIVATICRTTLGIAVFNCALFALSIYAAGGVAGVKRRTFACLLALNALTLPALMTLNKEILALAGIVLFAKYLYSRNRPWWLMAAVVLLSTMARWQQTVFIFIFLFMQSWFWPLRKRHRSTIALLILFLSAAWALISLRFEGLVSAYTALQAEINSGTIARLNGIQARGGFFLVVWPKILMNVSGRLVQVNYFLTEWIHEDFHELQNTLIGNLHSVALLGLLAVMFFKGRLRLGRPLVYFTLTYFILTAVSPLVQNRYEYPAYVLLAMEMSRDRKSLEPVPAIRKLPPLPRVYKVRYVPGTAVGSFDESARASGKTPPFIQLT